MPDFFDTSIEFLKGVGPQRADLLRKELNIFTFGDLLYHYPFRYDDRTKFYAIKEVTEEMPYVQLKGKIARLGIAGGGRAKRLVAAFKDETGELELVWFRGIKWTLDKVKPNIEYIILGKPNRYGKKISIAHPEIELVTEKAEQGGFLQPVYPLTEQLRSRYLDNKALVKLKAEVLRISLKHIYENLPAWMLQRLKLLAKPEALQWIHFPPDQEKLLAAQYRLKFEELFYLQIRLLKMKLVRQKKSKGLVFSDTKLLTDFYTHHLPFELTEAQKKVIREIYTDLKSGQQMNRLLQGDVGSGKTIVAFISLLLAVGSGCQAALMAPTEILAQQHFANLKKYADKMGLSISLLTGSTKKTDRKKIHAVLESGELSILIGTHALLEEVVKFNQLGLAIIDEQHRFGVAQRSMLWKKSESIYPHVLVMTATPIPRTLAMTLYGDLDISVIDELPKGRKPIKTMHRFDSHRLVLNQFLREQIKAGQQIYVVYPLIEESEKLDFKHLMDGYESFSRAFPGVPISILHGRMNAEAKEFEMDRFLRNETKIMVATTVIEVGVDVPNASVMVIESAERFGLSQLHQLRGRVGRGATQSYCILVTGYKQSEDSKIRMETMVKTNNGFDIAETDLRLRGPGDLMGTQQSGLLDLTIADLSKDGKILKLAREVAIRILDQDPELTKPANLEIKKHLQRIKKSGLAWSKVG